MDVPFQSAFGDQGRGVLPQGHAVPTRAEPAKPVTPKRLAYYLWEVLIARIYEVFPLLCPMCGGQIRLIAFVTEGVQTGKILKHIGVDPEPSHIAHTHSPGARATAVGRLWCADG